MAHDYSYAGTPVNIIDETTQTLILEIGCTTLSVRKTTATRSDSDSESTQLMLDDLIRVEED